MIGTKLQEIANISEKLPETKSESKIITIVSTSTTNESNKLMGPLKSSRAGNSIQINTSNEKTGSSRLLSTALQSTRTVIDNKSKQKDLVTNDNKLTTQLSTSRDNTSSKNVNSRNVQLQGQKREHQEVNFDVNGKKKMKMNQNLKATENSSQIIAIGSVEYFEKMNQVAQQSGFKNAQEMIASQKEMMALLQQPPPPPPPQAIVHPVSSMTTIATAFPPQVVPYQQYTYPYTERGGRGRGRWVEGRVGRGGRGGRFPIVDTTIATTTTENNSIEPQATSMPVSSTDPTQEAQVPIHNTTYPNVFRGGRTNSYWQERGGRGVFTGRSSGRFGRAPIVGNKTWVRPTDLETPLASNR